MDRLFILGLQKVMQGLNAEINENETSVVVVCNDDQTLLIADAFIYRHYHGKKEFKDGTYTMTLQIN